MSSGYDSYFKQAKKSSKSQPKAKPKARAKAKSKATPKKRRVRRKSQSLGTGWVLMMVLLFGIFTAGYLNLDEVDKLLAKVEVNFHWTCFSRGRKGSG